MATTTALALPGMKKMGHNALARKYLAAKSALARVKEGAGEKIEGIVKTLEIQAGAFAGGAIQGIWYDPNPAAGTKPGAHVFGMPIEAVAGFAGLAGSLFGIGGDKWSSHLGNLSNGLLASYTSNLGRAWGYKLHKDRVAKKGKGGKTSGADLRDEIASLLDE